MRHGSLRRRVSVCCVALATGGIALAASGDATGPQVDLVLAQIGEPYYRSYCASCHGLDGTGDGPMVSALVTRPADLTRMLERRGGAMSDGEIAKFIDGRFEVTAHGTREMPVWGARFSEQVPDAGVGESMARGKIAALVEYLKSIQVQQAPSGTLQEEMSEIFDAMRFLLPLSLDEKKFSDPAQREKIDAALALLARSSEGLEVHGRSEDAGFFYLSRALAVDARDVHQRFEAGYTQEARFLVQQLTETCVACHSTLPSPSARLRPRLADDDTLASLPLDERAKMEYATRQFDRALASYEALLASDELSATDLDMLGMLDDYLELCIRVMQDYEAPLRTLQRFAKRDDLNLALRGEVRSWILSLQELSRRKPLPDALDEARALLRQIRESGRFEDERDALVYYLQASGVLHRYLDAAPHSPSNLAETYYLLGLIETEVGKSFWLSQAEAYLEAAIRTAPRDPIAQQAYDLLEEFLVAGYTGSDGTHVPPDIQRRLDELRVLCEQAPAS